MKRLVLSILLLALLLAAPRCASEDESEWKIEEIVIGFTSSQTGKYNVSSTRQVNGLNLWADGVNNAREIVLNDNTRVKVKLVSYDDESDKDRVQELYTRLATEDNVDFMISPYSSGLTAIAAGIAEQHSKLMLTAGAASDA